MYKTAKEKRVRRHVRVRGKISGTAARPRLCVSITANNMYVQFIDDEAGVTMAATSTLSAEFKALNLKRSKKLEPIFAKIIAMVHLVLCKNPISLLNKVLPHWNM